MAAIHGLKNNFVHLTQLACDNPCRQKKKWKADLAKAFDKTVKELCPDWESNTKDRGLFDLIQKETEELKKRSPRQNWLQEKAYAWLKSLSPADKKSTWYPELSIKIAYQIFLRGAGNFRSFVKYLEKRKQPAIMELIAANKRVSLAQSTGMDRALIDLLVSNEIDDMSLRSKRRR